MLRQINGIGPKTIDYLKMLSGVQAIAIDRHLFSFLELAGILNRSYNEANLIYSKASELLGISKYELDRKVWLYMSKASN
jgi:thermostable 8-oxoguanine DNA glycosylase